MYKHINSASRIHRILARAGSLPRDQNSTVAMWSRTFDTHGAGDLRTAELVMLELQRLHDELSLLESQVKRLSISPHLYETALTNIRTVISPLYLASPWNSVNGNLPNESLTALAFLAEMLPGEENAIDGGHLSSIATLAVELSELLKESDLPPRLRSLIEHHIELILKAIAEYPIRGVKALREAGYAAMAEILEAKDIIREHAGTSAVRKLDELWDTFNGTADAALKVDGLIQLTTKAWDVVKPLLGA